MYRVLLAHLIVVRPLSDYVGRQAYPLEVDTIGATITQTAPNKGWNGRFKYRILRRLLDV